ncbi:MAG: hypothetical protein CM15mP65_01440 [Crocinitomicaceae bacterium]|nr:MAG: hypothetical protein CM15mP65_01440 [Crocinitomicaceae bacterium]
MVAVTGERKKEIILPMGWGPQSAGSGGAGTWNGIGFAKGKVLLERRME